MISRTSYALAVARIPVSVASPISIVITVAPTVAGVAILSMHA
ncbi:MAG TPA: hypothetical protein VJH69_00375 [Candidatus Paceibacterota bacterium]